MLRVLMSSRFMLGEIPYKDSITGERTYYVKSPKVKGGKLMSEERRSEFRAKSLAFQDYQGLTHEQEMEIFSVSFHPPLVTTTTHLGTSAFKWASR